MKNYLIKFVLCLIVSSLFINCTNLFVYAEEDNKNVNLGYVDNIKKVNEYDIMVLEKKESTKKQKNTIHTTKTYEELYLERAQLSEEILINEFLYTIDQVKILKEYDGSPIEENPQLAKASAVLSARMYTGGCSNTELNVMVEWSWSNAPILSGPGVTDRIAFRWKGTSTTGSPINLVDNGSTYAMIYYYNSGSYVTTTSVNRTLIDSYGAAEMPVKMQVSTGTALRGTVSSTLRNSGSAKILEAGIVFVYGHCKIDFTSLSFGYGTWPTVTISGGTKEITLAKRVTNTGNIIN